VSSTSTTTPTVKQQTPRGPGRTAPESRSARRPPSFPPPLYLALGPAHRRRARGACRRTGARERRVGRGRSGFSGGVRACGAGVGGR
jgi:hypothetical protein